MDLVINVSNPTHLVAVLERYFNNSKDGKYFTDLIYTNSKYLIVCFCMLFTFLAVVPTGK